MHKSFYIIVANKEISNYILKEFKKSNIDGLRISCIDYKKNIKLNLHLKDTNTDLFYTLFSNIISSCIIQFYEKRIIKHIISTNYFYFTNIEQQKIYNIVLNYLNNNEINECVLRKDSIKLSCMNYFPSNEFVILNGFINFRLNDYVKILDYIIDLSVNKFIIDKEYQEFIDTIKNYINSKGYNDSLVHLIYYNQESILLDEYKNTINLSNSPLDKKFISDISFSSNDYTLNALLTLLPKRIYIHIIDEIEDDFIRTLKILFDKRIYICNDCNICATYKPSKANKL